MSNRASLKSAIVPIRNVVSALEHAPGIPVEDVLANTGLEARELEASDRLITYEQYLTALRNVCSLMPSPVSFLQSTKAFDISSYGILGYAMMSAENLGRAIEFAMKYYRTGGPLFRLSFEYDEEDASISLEPLFVLEPKIARAATELLLAGFPPLVAELLGKRVVPRTVALAYADPGLEESYQRTFQCPIVFGARQTRYTIDAEELKSPVLHADADAMRMLEASCRALLDELEDKASLRGRIRHLLLSSPGQPMLAERIARELNISERTLRRHLRREGCSFQQIVDEVRASMAKDYLRSTNLSTQQIAELVGFFGGDKFPARFSSLDAAVAASVPARPPGDRRAVIQARAASLTLSSTIADKTVTRIRPPAPSRILSRCFEAAGIS